MEFEAAARRLAKDQSKIRGRRGPPVVSAKAKREAEYRKKQQEKLREEREKKRLQLQHAHQYMNSCDRDLAVTSLGVGTETSLMLQPTSIHGEGDKIALPPSVLGRLTASDGSDTARESSPWTFRVGLLRPGYAFPQSRKMKEMQPDQNEADSDDEDVQTTAQQKAPYLEELFHKYVAYTYATVVEFTQDEGHVGLPLSVASALLDPTRRRSEDDNTDIPVTRTVDPASSPDDNAVEHVEEEKTPGHLAWGAFDVPNVEVEVTLVRLPKGKACTLVPTEEAIRNGFYGLKDIKLVLEQSLIRSRATLSVGDVVHSWHRGFKYDLSVASVVPSDYHAVSCVNTDIEVEFGSTDDARSGPDTMETEDVQQSALPEGGRTLSSISPAAPVAKTKTSSQPSSSHVLPEPPSDQKEGVCTVLIRGPDGETGRHRFDVSVATVQDLFAFAGSLISENDVTCFRLVTRFPRNVYSVSDQSAALTLVEAGISAGQELFLVEPL